MLSIKPHNIIFNEAEKKFSSFFRHQQQCMNISKTKNETEKNFFSKFSPVSTSVLLTVSYFSLQFHCIIFTDTPLAAIDPNLRTHHLFPSNFYNFPHPFALLLPRISRLFHQLSCSDCPSPKVPVIISEQLTFLNKQGLGLSSPAL